MLLLESGQYVNSMKYNYSECNEPVKWFCFSPIDAARDGLIGPSYGLQGPWRLKSGC